jgi:hypothetical protein
MQHAFPLQPFANTKVGEKVRRPMLDQARPYTIFDIVAAAVLDDDRFNALQVEKRTASFSRPPDDTDCVRM